MWGEVKIQAYRRRISIYIVTGENNNQFGRRYTLVVPNEEKRQKVCLVFQETRTTSERNPIRSRKKVSRKRAIDENELMSYSSE